MIGTGDTVLDGEAIELILLDGILDSNFLRISKSLDAGLLSFRVSSLDENLAETGSATISTRLDALAINVERTNGHSALTLGNLGDVDRRATESISETFAREINPKLDEFKSVLLGQAENWLESKISDIAITFITGAVRAELAATSAAGETFVFAVAAASFRIAEALGAYDNPDGTLNPGKRLEGYNRLVAPAVPGYVDGLISLAFGDVGETVDVSVDLMNSLVRFGINTFNEILDSSLDQVLSRDQQVITSSNDGGFISSSAENDVIIGSGNFNIFYSSKGSDVFVSAGQGSVLSYAPSTQGVRADVSLGQSFIVPSVPQNFRGALGIATLASVPSVELKDYFYGIQNVVGSAFDDSLTGSELGNRLNGESGADLITGGLGDDLIDGGANIDTARFTGNRSAYTITQTAAGAFQITGPDGTDTLTTIEFAEFADQTLRLLPGTGTNVDFAADPATYMAAIRDFDGNDLGAAADWVRIGSADVNGDGDFDHIYVNRTNGRFAEVGIAADGKAYFSDHGWAGETRVVGIYIDPLVASGEVAAGGDFDSQRRFQNDLFIGNIARVLGADDYDGDGLQEVYFALTDGTAYLHAYMHADGNIRYANYQSEAQVIAYLDAHGFAPSTYDGWF